VSISIVFVALMSAFVHTVCNVCAGREFMFSWVVRVGVSGCVCGSGCPLYLYLQGFVSPHIY
jgi:hypothetical protein